MRIAIVLISLVLLLGIAGNVEAQEGYQFGENWKGQFYNTLDLTGAIVAQVNYPTGFDNLDWGTGSPFLGVNADGWSAVFQTTAMFDQSPYEFKIAYGGSVVVYLDNRVFIDPGDTDGDNIRGRTEMTAGLHTITIVYADTGETANLAFNWVRVDVLIDDTSLLDALNNANSQLAGLQNPLTSPQGTPILPAVNMQQIFGWVKWIFSPATAEELFGPFAGIYWHLGIYIWARIALLVVYGIVFVATYLIRWVIWIIRLIMDIINAAQAIAGALINVGIKLLSRA